MNRSNFRELGGKGNYRTYPNIKKSLVFIQVHYSRLLTALLTLWSWQFDQTANTEGGSKKKSVLIGSSLGFPAGISTEGGSANVALGDQTQKVLLLLPVFFFSYLADFLFIYFFLVACPVWQILQSELWSECTVVKKQLFFMWITLYVVWYDNAEARQVGGECTTAAPVRHKRQNKHTEPGTQKWENTQIHKPTIFL